MKKYELQRLQKAIQAIREPLENLERLLATPDEDEQRFIEMQRLHEVDPACGDYVHRSRGKQRLPGRFRHSEKPVVFTEQQLTEIDRNAKRQTRTRQSR